MIGDPVRHSLSPAIHNAGFEALGLDWVYLALPVTAGNGGAAVQAMRTLGIDGLSVTMPHKADVALAVDDRTEVVETLGVCNCVFRQGDRLIGDSTDGDGFVRSLAVDNDVRLSGARVLVVGTGGAATAIIEAVGRQDAAAILVVSRSMDRAIVAARLAPQARAADAAEAATADVIVNASPVGMAGGPDPDGLPISLDHVGQAEAVADIVYNPRRTKLLIEAEERGLVAIDGVGMLLHQAALAFERWTGVPAPLEAMRNAVFPPAS